MQGATEVQLPYKMNLYGLYNLAAQLFKTFRMLSNLNVSNSDCVTSLYMGVIAVLQTLRYDESLFGPLCIMSSVWYVKVCQAN